MMKSSMIIHPEELSVAWIDRMVEAGITTLGIHPRGGKEAARALEELLDRMQTAAYRDRIDYARRRGLTVVYELHAAGYLMPRELFREHPEYFRMNEQGERTDDYNFCVTDPVAMALYARRAAERIAREKERIAPLMRYFGRGSAKKFAKILEYWYDNSLFSHWKKPPERFRLNEEGMRRDIEEYREMGFDCIATFACFLGEDYEERYGEVDITPFSRCMETCK